MRLPTTRKTLLHDLRERILTGRYPAGYRFPREPDFAGELGCARGTLRMVLGELEKEDLIERIAREGTFVKDFRNRNDRTIYYLLPCADYMLRSGYRPCQTHLQMISAALRTASQEKDYYQVAPIPVSQTNEKDDIDFELLQIIPRGGRVIVCNAHWYENVLPFLKERDCRVAVVAPDAGPTAACRKNKWQLYVTDYEQFYREIARCFHEHGVRKALIADIRPENEFVSRMREAFAESGISSAGEDVLTLPEKTADARELLRRKIGTGRYGGLYFSHPFWQLLNRESINKDIGIPPELLIVSRGNFMYYEELEKPLPHFCFDYGKVAEMATRWLIGNEPPSIVTVGETIHFIHKYSLSDDPDGNEFRGSL